jgi:RNA polymerase sigma factor (sigma-70 family)
VSPGLSDLPDEVLWQRAIKHEGKAFGELYERHANAVYNHCFRRTASWSLAEDVTSAVFLEAWRRRKEVRLHGDSVRPWLLAVANNALRNAQRSVRRQQRLLSKLPPPTASSAFEGEADQRIDDERAMGTILERINELRLEEREIIALCDWAQLSYAEAATALGIPIGTVRSRLSRAHEHLRQLPVDAQVGDPNNPNGEYRTALLARTSKERNDER